MMNAEDPITGHVVPDKVLMHAMPLEAGKYRDPDLARKYLKKKVRPWPQNELVPTLWLGRQMRVRGFSGEPMAQTEGAGVTLASWGLRMALIIQPGIVGRCGRVLAVVHTAHEPQQRSAIQPSGVLPSARPDGGRFAVWCVSQGAVIEAAAKPNGAADLLPENAPPPWVLTPGGTASGHDERIHAIMAQNDELSLHLEVRAGRNALNACACTVGSHQGVQVAPEGRGWRACTLSGSLHSSILVIWF
jgi:hypothetical protein